MGFIKRKVQKHTVGSIRVVDPRPVWIGTTDEAPHIKRMMSAEEAERWVKEAPGRNVMMRCKKYQLENIDEI